MREDRRCLFETHESGKVHCLRCGRIVTSPHPPEKVYAPCRALAPYGVGDVIAWLANRTGIAAWWHRRTAPAGGCGCQKRQAALNRALPFPARVRGLLAILAVWWRERG